MTDRLGESLLSHSKFDLRDSTGVRLSAHGCIFRVFRESQCALLVVAYRNHDSVVTPATTQWYRARFFNFSSNGRAALTNTGPGKRHQMAVYMRMRMVW